MVIILTTVLDNIKREFLKMTNEQIEALNILYNQLDEKTDGIADKLQECIASIKASPSEDITDANINLFTEMTIFQAYGCLQLTIIEMLKDNELSDELMAGIAFMLEFVYGLLNEQAKDIFIADTTLDLTERGALDDMINNMLNDFEEGIDYTGEGEFD